jgi:hypothetical protein
MKGSLEEELLLWCFFLLPGFLYSSWRRGDAYYACPNCGASPVIPLESLTANKFLSEGYLEPVRPEHDLYRDTGEDLSGPGNVHINDPDIAPKDRAGAAP